jgi:hypothetical protein
MHNDCNGHFGYNGLNVPGFTDGSCSAAVNRQLASGCKTRHSHIASTCLELTRWRYVKRSTRASTGWARRSATSSGVCIEEVPLLEFPLGQEGPCKFMSGPAWTHRRRSLFPRLNVGCRRASRPSHRRVAGGLSRFWRQETRFYAVWPSPLASNVRTTLQPALHGVLQRVYSS